MARRQSTERRESTRFPVERRLYYTTLNRHLDILAGRGKTLNISSTGILFTADHKLPVGTSLEMHIEWPSNEKGVARLIVRGRVTREHEKGIFALQIKQYELRRVPPESLPKFE